MRRFDKVENIRKANLLAEQRYLESKGLINENNDTNNVVEKLFNYDIIRIKETEKAILIKFRVYKNKEGKEEFLDTWLPKSILNNEQKVSEFIQKTLDEKNKNYFNWMRSKGYGTQNLIGYTTVKPKEKQKITTYNYSISPDSPKPKGLDEYAFFIINPSLPLYNDYEIFSEEIRKKYLKMSSSMATIKEDQVYYFDNVELLLRIIEKYPNLYISTKLTLNSDAVNIQDVSYDKRIENAKNRGINVDKELSDFKNKHGFEYKETIIPINKIKIIKNKRTYTK
jgi:hypothetical protein